MWGTALWFQILMDDSLPHPEPKLRQISLSSSSAGKIFYLDHHFPGVCHLKSPGFMQGPVSN